MKKKCIVLDLDNTLWGGVVGEEGTSGIALSLHAPGSYFIAFQQALLDLYHRGIILAINSTNNPADAFEVLQSHPNMILRMKHFAAMRINWEDKVDNMRSLARELNIGLDSMVFLDDNPTNRSAMREFLPEVETPELSVDPAQYAQFLLALPYFESSAITDEDKMRGNLYVTERLRRAHEQASPDRDAFLRSLKLTMQVYKDDPSALARLSQLSEKTNQFNTHKIPLTVEQLQSYLGNDKYVVLYGKITDAFGDYGITAFALIRKEAHEWVIESLLMSCRVLGRGMEQSFLYAISREAISAGVSKLSIDFIPTEKNTPAAEFVEKFFKGNALSPQSVRLPSWVRLI